MEQIRLIMLVESRIRGDVYVRFGGEYLKTYHSNMIRRWVLSLLIQYGLNRLILHFQVNSCILSIAICSLCQANRTEQQEYV